ETQAEGRVPRLCPGGIADEDVDLAGLQRGESLLAGGGNVFHLGGIAEHGGGKRLAVINVETGPVTLVVGLGKAGETRIDAAIQRAARRDGVERLALSEGCAARDGEDERRERCKLEGLVHASLLKRAIESGAEGATTPPKPPGSKPVDVEA